MMLRSVPTVNQRQSRRRTLRENVLSSLMSASLPPEAPDERYFHDDLLELSDDALRRERVLLRMAVHLSPCPDWWLNERLLRIAQEEGRRCGR